MLDPLRRVSVRIKLALLFVGLCLIAYGLGGVLVSRWSERALEEAILGRLELQSGASAAALDVALGGLLRRAEDFASDGLIRGHAARLAELPEGSERQRHRDELRDHLARNKLPLVPAFLDLSVVAADGTVLASAREDGGLLRSVDPGFPAGELRLIGPGLLMVKPLRGVVEAREVGRLAVLVDGRRLLGGVLDAAVTGLAGAQLALRDREGQAVHESRGAGLPEAPLRPASRRGSLARDYPLSEAPGWTVQVALGAGDALAPVAGLRNRLLGVGVMLAALSSLLLFFPMRFVVSPLVRLTRAAERLKDGHLDTRVEIESDDEIGDLGRAFNGMADAIAERTHSLQAVATELRDRQTELKAGRDRLQAVINSMQDGLVVLDAGGHVAFSNAAARGLLDLVECGLHAQGRHVCREENARGKDCFGCLLDPAGPQRSCLVDSGGRSYEIHTTMLPAPGGGAGDGGRLLVAREITDRIARDEREIHNERLAVLGEVAAVMAHELNNPLASISMFNQMLARALPEGSPLRENTDVIGRNTESAKRTIRELLDYATGASPEVDAVDVHATLHDVVRFLRPLAERAGVALRIEAGAANPAVTGDEVQLRQVFVNLALNGIQAVAGQVPRPGEGRRAPAVADGRAREVLLRTRDDGDRLEVDVCDTGPGIPPELRERIFRPFFTTKERGEGTGLGLPTTRRIAELHGGSLALVESSPAGSVFRVRLRARALARGGVEAGT